MARIAVVGGGPKAVALAAKAAALRIVGADAPEITVFDSDGIAAAWTGTNGYTDGEQLLCTPVERDLGFPYLTRPYSKSVADKMMECFSWHAFLRDVNRLGEWTDRGRPRPSHKDFARYLQHAFLLSKATLVPEKVTGLDVSPATTHWTVKTVRQDYPSFDGIVWTGSGPPKRALPNAAPRCVFDGADFWKRGRLAEVEALVAGGGGAKQEVVIIGAGGTAGAVAAWFVRKGLPVALTIVGPQPTLFCRTENYFENRLFTDAEDWNQLSTKAKRDCLGRLSRGVLWDTIAHSLSAHPDIRYQTGSAENFIVKGIRVDTRGYSRPELQLRCSGVPGRGTAALSALLFVDTRGFDACAFLDCLPNSVTDPVHDALAAAVALLSADIPKQEYLEYLVGSTLALERPFPCPNFHVPMLGGLVHPGAPNLMALGAMTDLILTAYVPPF